MRVLDILVVDDDHDLASGVADMLEAEGHRAALSCRKFRDNAVRHQLHAVAYNLANFMRTLALPKEVEHWSLTTLRA